MSSALLAVCGAHLQGQPLHPDLTGLGAELVEVTTTAPIYQMVLLADGDLPRPGLIRRRHGGAALEVEVYRLAVAALGPLLVGVRSPLALGSVVLVGGQSVLGFVCEGFVTEGFVTEGFVTEGFVTEGNPTVDDSDITRFGGWRSYLATR